MTPGLRSHKSASLRLVQPPLGVANLREVTEFRAWHPRIGHGSALMRKVCKEADRTRCILVLNPQGAELEPWYSRFGFVVIQREPAVLMARERKQR